MPWFLLVFYTHSFLASWLLGFPYHLLECTYLYEYPVLFSYSRVTAWMSCMLCGLRFPASLATGNSASTHWTRHSALWRKKDTKWCVVWNNCSFCLVLEVCSEHNHVCTASKRRLRVCMMAFTVKLIHAFHYLTDTVYLTSVDMTI